MVEFIGSDLRHRNTSVTLDVNQPALEVIADKIQIQQVLLNLVRNAVDAMEELNETMRQVTIHAAAADNKTVKISVTDTGPGIPSDQLTRIFDSFFTTKPDGMGLGLNICYSIIENHGGHMWASSEPGGGAGVHFILPAYTKRNQNAVA